MLKEELLVRLNKSTWEIQVFNATPLYITAVGINSGWLLENKLGLNYTHFLLLFKDKVARYYYDAADFRKIGEAFFDKYQSLERINGLVEFYRDEYQARLAAEDKEITFTTAASALNALRKAMDRLTASAGITHMIEGIEYYAESKLRSQLAESGITESEFGILCSPIARSNFLDSQEKLWRIKNSPRADSLIDEYIRDYSWCEANYIGAPLMKREAVIRRAESLKLQPLFHDYSAEKKEIIGRLSLNEDTVFVIKAMELVNHWHDERKKNVLCSIMRADAILNQVAAFVDLDPEILKFCLPAELEMNNLTNPTFIRKLRERSAGLALYATPKENLILTGDNYQSLADSLQKPHDDSREIKGTIACRGFARGRVVQCQSVAEMELVKDGDILVTSMTRPEFMPAMQRADAIITDEGGLTCHAAIISRELNIPCIIGTKNGTQILKTGDLVEVDANSGIIRKINQI